MTPPARDHITWSIIGRVTIGALVAWAAYEFREMRTAVYKGQTSIAVIENKIENMDNKVENIDSRVKYIESRLHKEQ